MFFRRQKAAGNDNRIEPASPEETEEATVIAAGTQINGNLECEGDLRIEGFVRGSVRARKLVLGHDGVIEGDVAAEEVVVQGYVKGPLRASHVHLHSGATVEGDVASATIAIDTGARLSGAVWQEQDEQAKDRGLQTPSFSASWDRSEDDAFRPLAAIRPRTGLAGR